jgi:hypothetical protein
MQVHIHHPSERKYLAPHGRWVMTVKSARAFPNAKEAVEYCRAEKLKGMELLILRPPVPPLTMPITF